MRGIVGRVVVVVVDIDRGNDCCAVFGIEARTMRWDVALNIIYALQLFTSCRVSLKATYYPNRERDVICSFVMLVGRKLSPGDFGGPSSRLCYDVKSTAGQPLHHAYFDEANSASSLQFVRPKMCGRYSLGVVCISTCL